MNRQNQHRPSGIGAFKPELERIKIWIHNSGRHWFTASDVNISGQTLAAMAKRNLIRTAGRVGSHQTFALRSGGWVIP